MNEKTLILTGRRVRLQLAGDEAITGRAINETAAYLLLEAEPPPGLPPDSPENVTTQLAFPWGSIQAVKLLGEAAA